MIDIHINHGTTRFAVLQATQQNSNKFPGCNGPARLLLKELSFSEVLLRYEADLYAFTVLHQTTALCKRLSIKLNIIIAFLSMMRLYIESTDKSTVYCCFNNSKKSINQLIILNNWLLLTFFMDIVSSVYYPVFPVRILSYRIKS